MPTPYIISGECDVPDEIVIRVYRLSTTQIEPEICSGVPVAAYVSSALG